MRPSISVVIPAFNLTDERLRNFKFIYDCVKRMQPDELFVVEQAGKNDNSSLLHTVTGISNHLVRVAIDDT